MRRAFVPGLLGLLGGLGCGIQLVGEPLLVKEPMPRAARRRKAGRPAQESGPIGHANRRSRGPAAKPKRRPNRNHISRRVRRRHRRKAA